MAQETAQQTRIREEIEARIREAEGATALPKEVPSYVGKSGGALTTHERVRKIQALQKEQSALQEGRPLPAMTGMPIPEEQPGVLSDIGTTFKLAGLIPISGALTRGETELELRGMTRDIIAKTLPEDSKKAIEVYAGKKIDSMKWHEFEEAAIEEFGDAWYSMTRSMMGFQEGDKNEPTGEEAFPKAYGLISGSRQSAGSFYETFVRKWFSDDSPRLSKAMIKAVERATEGYSERAKAGVDKPMVAEDSVWYNPFTYFDDSTKDPFHDLTGFLHTAGQQSGNLAGMIIAARLGGGAGARSYTKSLATPTTSAAKIQAMQKTGATIGGAAAGGKAEALLIRDGVFSEVHQRITNDLPEEVWAAHDPFLDLVECGLSKEEAKQVIAMQHANNAGDTAMVLSGVLMGTPMGAFYGSMTGRSAARTAAQKSILSQMGRGAALETGQEMSQELTEQVVGNLAVRRVDPNQDLWEGGLEAVTTAFFISAVPGALGGIHGERGAGISAERDKLIRRVQPYVNAANERWKHQNKVGPNTAFAKDASAQDQLKAMIELERLQKKEAQEFMKVRDDARRLMEKTGVADDKMIEFDAQTAGYESTLANIAKQQTRRSESRKALREETRALKERQTAEKSIQRDVQNMSDALRLSENMRAVQKNEALTQEQYDELAKQGYGKYVGANNENFVLTPIGRRAMKELRKHAGSLHDKIESGYTGEERRTDPKRRERIEGMTEQEVETELYTDPQTKLRSRRAWDEEKDQANAYASIDADSLKWVNDNMSHSAGDAFIKTITDELRELGEGYAAYRTGGDEFVVTGPDVDSLTNVIEQANARIANKGRVEEGGQSIKATLSIGVGDTYGAADRALQEEKARRLDAGERIDSRDKGGVPPSFRVGGDEDTGQLTLFQLGPKIKGPARPLGKVKVRLVSGEQVIYSQQNENEIDVPARLAEIISLDNLPEVTTYGDENYISASWLLRQINRARAAFTDRTLAGDEKLTSLISDVTIDNSLLDEPGVPVSITSNMNRAAELEVETGGERGSDRTGHVKGSKGVRVKNANAIFEVINTIAAKYNLYDKPSNWLLHIDDGDQDNQGDLFINDPERFMHDWQYDIDGYYLEYLKWEAAERGQPANLKWQTRKVDPQHMKWLEEVSDELLPKSNTNNPGTTIAQDPADLYHKSKRQYEELLDTGHNIWTVRGLFSLDDPTHGVFLIASNIISLAEAKLELGDRIDLWSQARQRVTVGDQAEVIMEDGKIRRATVTDVQTAKYQPVTQSMSERRVEKKLGQLRKNVIGLKKRVDKLTTQSELLSDEEYNNNDNPLIIKLDDSIDQWYSLKSQVRALEFERQTERNTRWTNYKPPDLTNDSITVKFHGGGSATFNPTSNTVVSEVAGKPVLGRRDFLKGILSAASSAALPELTETTVDDTIAEGLARQVVEKILPIVPQKGESEESQQQRSVKQIQEMVKALNNEPIFKDNPKRESETIRQYADRIKEKVKAKVLGDYAQIDMEEKTEGMKLGRIRHKTKLAGTKARWSSIWHTNIGNIKASLDEKLTKRHLREMVADTLMHETVGHYGIRGITEDYKTYERLTHAIVDSFPEEVAELRKLGYEYRSELSPSQNKALLGEEIVAWRAGGVFSQMKELTPIQRTVLERFMLWFKQQLMRFGWRSYKRQQTAKKIRTARQKLRRATSETGREAAQEELNKLIYISPSLVRKAGVGKKKGVYVKSRSNILEDNDIITIIARSHDFIRKGKHKWRFNGEDGNLHTLPMRDSDIFTKPMIPVVKGGTRPLDADEMLVTEDIGDPPDILSNEQAYLEVTGNEMPEGWVPITPADFREETQEMMREKGALFEEYQRAKEAADGKLGAPVFLFDRATKDIPADQLKLFKDVKRRIEQSIKELDQWESQQRKLSHRKTLNKNLRKVFGDDAIDAGQVPLFPPRATLQGWLEATNDAVNRGYATKMEVEASGILNNIWPSRLKQIIADRGMNVKDFGRKVGIDEKRLNKLTLPATQMTAEEAHAIINYLAEGAEQSIDPSSWYTYGGFNEHVSLEVMQNNNALSYYEVSQFMSRVNPAMGWHEQMMLEGNRAAMTDIFKGYDELLQVAYGDTSTHEEKTDANNALEGYHRQPLGAGVTLSKKWLLDAIAKPEYYIIAGDPRTPVKKRSEHYESITGESQPSDYDRHASENADLEAQIADAQLEDLKRGPDIGFNPKTGKWYDPLSDYSNDSSWESLKPPGLIPGTYKIGVFYQVPSNSVRSLHMSWAYMFDGLVDGAEGMYSHVRHGLSQDADPNPPTARNPAMQGKATSAYEFQGDYAQKAARRYATTELKKQARELHKENKMALTVMFDNYVNKMMGIVIDNVEEEWNRIIPNEEALDAFKARWLTAEQRENLSDEESALYLDKYRANQLYDTGFMDNIKASINSITEPYRISSNRLSNLAEQGSNFDPPAGFFGSDARIFEMLDDKAATQLLDLVNGLMDRVAQELHLIRDAGLGGSDFDELTRVGGGLSWLKSGIDKGNAVRAGQYLRAGISNLNVSATEKKKYSFGFRLADMEINSKKILSDLIVQLEQDQATRRTPGILHQTEIQRAAADEKAAEMWETVSKVHQASVVLDIEPLANALNMVPDDVKYLLDKFGNYERAIGGPSVNITTNFSPEGSDTRYRFNFSGLEEHVNKMEELFKGKLIQYLVNKAPAQQLDTLRYAISNLESDIDSENNRIATGSLNQFKEEHAMDSAAIRQGWNSDYSDNSMGYDVVNKQATVEELESMLTAHEALTPKAYAEQAWRRAYPRMDGDYNADNMPNWKQTEYRNKYNSNAPFVIVGTIPVAWDEDGAVTDTVQMNVVKKRPASPYVLRIAGHERHSWSERYEFNNGYGRQIAEYYKENDIKPPVGSVFGPSEQLEGMKEKLKEKQDKLDEMETSSEELVTNASTDFPEVFDQKSSYGDLKKAFAEEINFYKRSGVQEFELIERNEQYRITQIQYMFSDLARRGIPRMFFFPGTTSGVRGGFVSNVDSARRHMVPTDKIEWSLEKKIIRGLERHIVIIKSEDINESLWIDVTKDNMLPFNPKRKINKNERLSGYMSGELTAQLGRYVSEDIAEKVRRNSIVIEKTTSPDDLLVVQTANSMWVVHDKFGGVIATVNSETEANLAKANFTGRTDEDKANIIYKGTTTRHELGVPVHLLKTTYQGDPAYHIVNEYQHTLSPGTMEGGRRNYDMVFMRALRLYAAKFDMKIEQGVMSVPSSDLHVAVQAHGLPEIVQLEEAMANKYTNIQIEEVTGENYGFIINSDGGLVLPNVFASQTAASDALLTWIDSNRIPASGVVKVYQITMSDKAIDHHLKPVSGFTAVQEGDSDLLKGINKKIGKSNEPRLVDRFNSWRKSWRAEFNTGVFDKLYGIQHAMNNVGIDGLDAADDPYIQARMTTGLESIMRGLMEYGHPVRRDGVIENEGEGLLEILSDVAENVELWAMYMVGVRSKRLMKEGREHKFTDEEIDYMVSLGETHPVFKDVAKKYAAFNKKVLDFAEASGVINSKTRPLWENADYIPFYRIVDDRLVGPLAKGVGIANQHSPIKTLKGGTANLGDLVHNIFTNLTNLMDSSIKNNAALMAIDTLKDSGIITKQPYAFTKELIPMGQVKKILQQNGIDPNDLESEVLEGVQTMFALQPPEGPGIISVMRDGKKEFYHTEDDLLYRSLSAINIKAFGAWMNLLRAPKRLLTSWVTLDPGFMIANWVRDSMSAFVLSRDNFVPIYHGIKGFHEAITEGETMRAMIGAGAAFESGYINQGDPQATTRVIKRAMRDKGFSRTVLDTPLKAYEAWKRIGSASENANRIAIYEAAIRAGKSKAQALYESKDIMDFSMGGDWPMIQFLIQTVPFMGARMQGLQRLGRGAAENPVGFATKGLMIGIAGLALWFAFRDDERYKELQDWDKDTYFHWWIGDNHFRLPKGFEVGAIFNTIPERIFEYMYSKENDAGRLLMQRWGFMLAETFNMNPIPQTFKPLVESWMNKNFFRESEIESAYEEKKLPPDRHRYYTSPTMRELAATMPKQLDLASQKIRSPLHLQNLYAGYTGTLGRYLLMASDAAVRYFGEYPEKPDMRAGDFPVISRFFRGDAPRRTRYEEEFYHMLRTTLQVQDSLRQADRTEDDKRYDEIEREYAPYVDAAPDLEAFRKEVSSLNREVREINLDEKMSGAEKRKQIDEIQREKNEIFKEAYRLRPSAQPKNKNVSQDSVQFLIDNFNVDVPEANDDLNKKAPATSDLVGSVSTMPANQLKRLEKASNYEPRAE